MSNVFLFSNNASSVKDFITLFFNNYPKDNINISEDYKISFQNPIEICDIISAVIDNNEKFNIYAWINLDENLYLQVTPSNIDNIIKYLYERYPY